MLLDPAAERLAALLRKTRKERHISLRTMAETAGVAPSVALRAERRGNAKLATWEKLFAALGFLLEFDAVESSEEGPDLIASEQYARYERRSAGLCAGKRRFY